MGESSGCGVLCRCSTLLTVAESVRSPAWTCSIQRRLSPARLASAKSSRRILPSSKALGGAGATRWRVEKRLVLLRCVAVRVPTFGHEHQQEATLTRILSNCFIIVLLFSVARENTEYNLLQIHPECEDDNMSFLEKWWPLNLDRKSTRLN